MLEQRDYSQAMEERRARQFIRLLGLSVGLRDLKNTIIERNLKLDPHERSYLELAQNLITKSMQSVLMDISETHKEEELVLAYDSVANLKHLPPQSMYEGEVYSFITENVIDDEMRGIR